MLQPVLRRLGGLLVLAVLAGTVAAEPEVARSVRGQPARAGAFGPIETWVLQFDPAMADAALPTFEDLLAATPPDAEVLVAVPHGRDRQYLESVLDPDTRYAERLIWMNVGQSLSCWARDRYVTFDLDGERRVLVMPEATVDEYRRGDVVVGKALEQLVQGARPVESRLILEGGNCIVTDEHVIVGAGVFEANMQAFSSDLDAIVEEIARVFGRAPVIVGEGVGVLPHDHVDMYVAALGPGVVGVADPRLAMGYFAARADLGVGEGEVKDYGPFLRGTQEDWIPVYDQIAEGLREAGFEVVRLPALQGEQDVLLTWTNAVLETVAGRARAYVPSYGVPWLDRMGQARWRELGYEVRPVRAEIPAMEGGAVRCLTNVIRSPRAAPTGVPAPRRDPARVR